MRADQSQPRQAQPLQMGHTRTRAKAWRFRQGKVPTNQRCYQGKTWSEELVPCHPRAHNSFARLHHRANTHPGLHLSLPPFHLHAQSETPDRLVM